MGAGFSTATGATATATLFATGDSTLAVVVLISVFTLFSAFALSAAGVGAVVVDVTGVFFARITVPSGVAITSCFSEAAAAPADFAASAFFLASLFSFILYK